MKAFHKALDTYDIGLKIEPDNRDLLDAKMRTQMKVQENMSSGGNDQERMAQAANDPEIQQIMKDPRIQQTLKDMQENPASAQAALKDPFISSSINKLVAAGVLRMG